MSEAKRQEFRTLVKAAHNAIDEFAEDRLSGKDEWFIRGLDDKARQAVHDLITWSADGERVVSFRTPLPSSVEMEDTEVIREYVDGQIAKAIADMVDQPSKT